MNVRSYKILLICQSMSGGGVERSILNLLDAISAANKEIALGLWKYEGELPCLIDFYADWCGPCKMIAPILDEIAEEYAGKLKITKLNIDENPATPPKFGIRGIPTLMIFKNGNVEATKVGAVSKSQLAAFIDSNL